MRFPVYKRRSRIGLGAWIVIPVMLVLRASTVPVNAQTTATGSVRGIVTDQQDAPVPGVLVSAASPTVPGVQTATTDRTGTYRLTDLLPGTYTITAELSGFARFVRTPVLVRAGLNLDVDIELRVGAIDETVEVRQDTPLLETEHAGQSVNLSGDLLRALPLNERREWFGALTLAPGLIVATVATGNPLFFVHGADAGANIVQIDGADMTPSTTSSNIMTNLNADAIDDVQVKTSGVDAATPLGLGGIINIATASGTDRVRGSATFVVQPRRWNGSNNPGGTTSAVDQRQIDLSAGAPAIKGALWAYAAYRNSDITESVSRTPAQLEALRGLVPGYTPLDTETRSHYWFAKASARLSNAHHLTAFYQYDVTPRRTADPTAVGVRQDETGGIGASVRLSSVWSSRLTTRVGASYNDKRLDVGPPEVQAPLERVYQGTILSAGRPTGNGLLVSRGAPFTAWFTEPNHKITLSLDATVVASGALGDHQVQTGVYAQPLLRRGLTITNVNSGFVLEDVVLRRAGDYSAGVVPFHRQIVDGTALVSSSLEGYDYAVYVQDAWRPVPRVTINAGVRIDRLGWRDRVFDVESVRSTQIGPRVGVNYALTGDTRNVARAHWVRVHDQPAAMAPSVGSTTLGFRDLYDFDLNGSFETEFTTPATFAVTRGRFIDPDLHLPFVQEWGTGFTRQFQGTLSLGVAVLRREFRDRPALVDSNGVYDGSVFRGYRDVEFNEVYTVTNNRWNTPVYTSLELSATKRTRAIQGLASYVRQWRHIDGTWQPNDPAAFLQPSAFANDRGIGATRGATSAPTDANSLTGTHMTQRATASSQWQDHTVRLGVSCSGPWQLLFASRYEYQSGTWSGPIVTRLASPDLSFGPERLTLSNGRIVTNPLATLIRFAYPTRGEQQLRTPAAHTWNVRVGRRFSWRRVTWEANVDVFNVTNHDADLSFQSGANQTYNPVYGLTTSRQLPRSAQGMIRATF